MQIRLFLGFFALVAGAAYLQSGLRACAGRLSPPLDDTYIYLQYARRLAEGHGFSYSGDAAASTGSTSLVHLLLLVPGWWAGLRDTTYLIVPLIFGVFLLALTLIGVREAAVVASGSPEPPRAASWFEPLLAFVLTGLCGNLLWGALSGMDTILFAAGLAGVLALVDRPGPRGWPFWWLLGSLSGLRPEGVVYAGVTLAVVLLRDRFASRGPTPGFRLDLRGPLLSVALLAVPFVVNVLATGAAQSDGMLAKSLFSEPRPEVITASLGQIPAVWRRIAGLYLSDFENAERLGPFRHLLTGLTGVGLLAGFTVSLAGRRGAAGILAALWVPLFVLLTSITIPWFGHNFRYQIPGVIPVALLVTFGWGALLRQLPNRALPPAALVVITAFALVMTPGALHMRKLYGLNCQNIRDQQETVGRWIRANTPENARIALNDAGAIAYFGERATLDLVGLTTHGWATRFREGSGALFEQLERLPVDERPALFAVYPSWFRALSGTRLLREAIHQVDLANNTICGARTKYLFRPDWSAAGSGALPAFPADSLGIAGLTLRDEVDVADRASEAGHDYRAGPRQLDILLDLPAGVAGHPPVADGGRRVSEWESFRVRLTPGRPARLVLRAAAAEAFELRVRANGADAGRVRVRGGGEAWSEAVVEIPGTQITETTTLRIERDPPHPRQGFPSFHYWLYQ